MNQEQIYYVGMDLHKKTITICVKKADGKIVSRCSAQATREALSEWLGTMKRPWIGAMEATMFTGWVYDFLKPHALELQVAHPPMLAAIVAGKHKNDRADAGKIADLLRVNLIPQCYMVSEKTRWLRRMMRYRNLMVREATRMKNNICGLLMECGQEYDGRRIHGGKYFTESLHSFEHVPDSIKQLMRYSRESLLMFQSVQKQLARELRNNPLLRRRVRRLMTIAGVGEAMALTWALEVEDPRRLGSIGKAQSYCGLCAAQNSSAGKDKRGPISKKRNKHLQTMLVEVAKLAPRHNAALKAVYDKELKRGNRNRATLAVARKLVAYMLAVDKAERCFEPRGEQLKPQAA